MLIYSTFSDRSPKPPKLISCIACASPHGALLSLTCPLPRARRLCRAHVVHLFGIISSTRGRTQPLTATPAHGVLGSWHPDTSLAPGVERRAFSTSLRSRRLAPSLLYISLSGADGSPPPPTGQQSSPLEIDVVSRFWGNVGNTPERNA